LLPIETHSLLVDGIAGLGSVPKKIIVFAWGFCCRLATSSEGVIVEIIIRLV